MKQTYHKVSHALMTLLLLVSTSLQYGEHVEVLEPKSLREAICDAIDWMGSFYR